MFKLYRCLVFIVFINALHGWKSYNVLFNNISTYADPAFLDMNITIASNKQAFDMHIMVKSEMQPYNLTVEILMSPTSENRYNTLIKRSLPFCEFAKGKYGDPIIKMLYEEIKMRGAQFIEKCPAPVGVYSIDGFTIDTEKLPPYLPDADIKMIMGANYLIQSTRHILYTIETLAAVDSSSSWKRIKMMTKKN